MELMNQDNLLADIRLEKDMHEVGVHLGEGSQLVGNHPAEGIHQVVGTHLVEGIRKVDSLVGDKDNHLEEDMPQVVEGMGSALAQQHIQLAMRRALCRYYYDLRHPFLTRDSKTETVNREQYEYIDYFSLICA